LIPPCSCTRQLSVSSTSKYLVQTRLHLLWLSEALVLVDLDNNLIDRTSAFDTWASASSRKSSAAL